MPLDHVKLEISRVKIMDQRFSMQDMVGFLARIAHDQGAHAASKYMNANIAAEDIAKSDWLKGMNCALQYAAINERKRLLSLNQALGAAGLFLPIEALFEFGLPRKEFIINIDTTNGRIGDSLGQLASYIHAMIELNLVLIVKPRLSRSARILLHHSLLFSEDLICIGSTPPLLDYLNRVAESRPFNRAFLASQTSALFDMLPMPKHITYGTLLQNGALVIHVRAGDALFQGAIALPPLRYYLNAIIASMPNFVIVVAEPYYRQKDPFPNPVPALIKASCNAIGVECHIQSSDDMHLDAATLFYAQAVVASGSSFSKWLPLYGKSCISLTLPVSPGNSHEWAQDSCMHYVDCWNGFDQDKWNSDLDYRLAWVTGSS